MSIDCGIIVLLQVTQDMFCESAVAYARGILPHDDRAALTHEQEHDFKEANILRKVQYYMNVWVHIIAPVNVLSSQCPHFYNNLYHTLCATVLVA